MTSQALIVVDAPSADDGLARAFSRWGWAGFWAQLAMGAIPLAIMIYTFVFASAAAGGSRPALPLLQLFSSVDVFLLLFVTAWFFRYTRMAKRIRDSARRPSVRSLRRSVWIGIVATTLAILFSMIVLLFEVGTLLFYFLAAPQAGVPTVQTTIGGAAGAAASWVSAVDMLSLISLILTLGGEILALIFGLLLLFRVMDASTQDLTAS